jgi:AraC-like DNA-binding protein
MLEAQSEANSISPVQMLSLRMGGQAYIEHYRTDHPITEVIEGADLLKAHVQLMGRRHLGFDKTTELELNGPSTLLVMHREGISKTESTASGENVRAVTVAVSCQRVRELFAADSPKSLRRLLGNADSAQSLRHSAPTSQERAAAVALLDATHLGPCRDMYMDSKATELFCLVLDRFQGTTESLCLSTRITLRDRQQLARVRDRLAESFLTPPPIPELARDYGLNRNKLCGGFSRLYGSSIYDFCSNLRLERARELLTQSDEPIKQIAHHCGFSSAAAFSNSFFRQFGSLPSHYRRRRLP